MSTLKCNFCQRTIKMDTVMKNKNKERKCASCAKMFEKMVKTWDKKYSS
ncbi:hypothetical protein [Aneurinibacillus tyrosinisolvens]|nr:hypothetical protein [Aneurinibacillus tyrosinisolvens]